MSLMLGSTVWNANQLANYRYFYERIPYTAMDPALASLTTPVVAIQNVSSAIPGKMAILSGLGVTATANVNLVPAGATNTTQDPTAGFPAVGQWIQPDEDDGLRSTGNLALSWENLTGAALTTLQQLQWYGSVKQLTVADKICRNLPLSPAEAALAQQYGLRAQDGSMWGLRAQTISRALDIAWKQALIEEVFQTVSVAKIIGGQQAQLQVTAQPKVVGQEVLVWHSLAASIPADSVGNGVVATIRRDDQYTLASVFLDGLTLANPLRPWVTAKEMLQLSLSANTTTANVNVRISWYRCRLTRVLALVLGLVPVADYTPIDEKFMAQWQAGVVI